MSGNHSRQSSFDMNQNGLNPVGTSRQTGFQSQNIQTSHIRQNEKNAEATRSQNSLYQLTGFPAQAEGQYNSTSNSNSDQFQSKIIAHPSRPASVNSSSHNPNSMSSSWPLFSGAIGVGVSPMVSEGYYRFSPSAQDMSRFPSRQAHL
jgi:hypothetical protein